MSAVAAAGLQQAYEPAFFTRVRLRAQRRVLWLREQWARDRVPAEALVIGDAEVDRILAGQHQPESSPFDASAIAEADRRFAQDSRWSALSQRLGLTAAEVDLLALAVAIDFDPWFRRVCGYLHDDATIAGATPWLAAQLFGHSPSTVLAPGGLTHWRLAAPAEAQQSWGPANVWLADPEIAAWLCSERTPVVPAPPPVLHERELEEALAFVRPIMAARWRTGSPACPGCDRQDCLSSTSS